MNYSVKEIIEINKEYIKENPFIILPGDLEYDISDMVKNSLAKMFINSPKLKKSTFNREIEQTKNNVITIFNNELTNEYNNIINNNFYQYAFINNCYASFLNQKLRNIFIPINVNELSHIYIGHEVIHGLSLNNNLKEWKYVLLYGETIPIFYEFMQADLELDNLKYQVFNFRQKLLFELNQHEANSLKYFDNNEDIRFYQIAEVKYFISYYYAILLYELYGEDKLEIIKLIKELLKQNITTFDLFKELNLNNHINEEKYNNGLKLIKVL